MNRFSEKLYKGKDPCIGCSKPGWDSPRKDKKSLCNCCIEDINAMKMQREKYPEGEITACSVRWYSIQNFGHRNDSDFTIGQNIEKSINDILKLLHISGLPQGHGHSFTPRSATTTSSKYVIPKKFVAPIQSLVDSCIKIQDVYKDLITEIEKERKEIMSNERNRIYNEGVDHGKNLLLRLNEGKITMDDFEKKINKY